MYVYMYTRMSNKKNEALLNFTFKIQCFFIPLLGIKVFSSHLVYVSLAIFLVHPYLFHMDLHFYHISSVQCVKLHPKSTLLKVV